MRRIHLFGVLPIALAFFVAIGCDKQQPGSSRAGNQATAQPADKHDAHDHEFGPHGGPIAEWGEGDYHAEFTISRDSKEVMVYILGPDARALAPINANKLLLSISDPSFQIDLLPSPTGSDPKGLSSRFAAKHATFAMDRPFAGTISGLVNGKPYAGEFQEKEGEAGHKTNSARPNSNEAALFLTPGGAYTQADIKANGGVVPSEKYKGFSPSHDIKTKPGDRLCPITLTKSNEKLTWVVNGKTYQFCCPPCLDEFVKMAKERPGELKNPEDYIKK